MSCKSCIVSHDANRSIPTFLETGSYDPRLDTCMRIWLQSPDVGSIRKQQEKSETVVTIFSGKKGKLQIYFISEGSSKTGRNQLKLSSV